MKDNVKKFDLMTIEKIDAVTVFTGGGVDPILKAITEEVRSQVPDTSTDKGRKAVASLAYKVSQSKTLLDAAGKKLVAGWKEQSKAVDGVRKMLRDSLDELRDEARQPLTDWELAEKELIAAKKLADEIKVAEAEAHQTNELIDREREIARKEAAQEKAEEEKRQKEATELAERERIEHEERIKVDAAEQATRAAQEAVDRAEREKVEAVERAEREKVEAVEAAKAAEEEAERRVKYEAFKAKEEKERAVKDERDRVERERLNAENEAEKRRRDTEHKASINRAIVAALTKECGVSSTVGKSIVSAIFKKKIPFIDIEY